MADSLKQDEQLISDGNRHILYDASLIEHPDVALFDLDKQFHSVLGFAEGRGHAVFFAYEGHDLVLKHYQRGGMVASLLDDKYLGSKPERSRAFREWRLLSQMHNMQLPVPQPVAANVCMHGIFHRSDLITKQIHNVKPLADCLLASELDNSIWQNIGACIRRFHDANVYHADLNARNIMLTRETGDVYLIDFDKGYIRQLGNAWKAANLARLQRSLNKFKSLNDVFHYDQADWGALLEGYRG